MPIVVDWEERNRCRCVDVGIPVAVSENPLLERDLLGEYFGDKARPAYVVRAGPVSPTREWIRTRSARISVNADEWGHGPDEANRREQFCVVIPVVRDHGIEVEVVPRRRSVVHDGLLEIFSEHNRHDYDRCDGRHEEFSAHRGV